MDVPKVGRIVHYVAYGTPGGEFPSNVCRAAIISEVSDVPAEGTSLVVLNPTGLFFNRWLKQDEDGKAPGTWHWPERT
jgi:hypothetical protein